MANFADLLKKIANNSRLTPQELDELGRFGTDTQQRNSQLSSFLGGTLPIDINANTIRANKILIGERVFSNVWAKFLATGEAPDSTNYLYPSYAKYWGDGFTTSGNKIYVSEGGIIRITVLTEWAFGAVAGVRDTDILINGFSNFTSAPSPSSYPTSLKVIELRLAAGSYIQGQSYQDSGAAEGVQARFFLEKVADVQTVPFGWY